MEQVGWLPRASESCRWIIIIWRTTSGVFQREPRLVAHPQRHRLMVRSVAVMQTKRSATYGPILIAVLLWLFSGSEIYQRATIELNGTIVSSTTTCMQPWNNRCATEYLVKAHDGSQQSYVAGPTDKSLPRRLSVGTVVVKRRWALSYSLNGRQVADFPIFFYSGLLILGGGCVIWWLLLRKRQ